MASLVPLAETQGVVPPAYDPPKVFGDIAVGVVPIVALARVMS